MMSFIESDQRLMARVESAKSPVEKLALLAGSALEGETAMAEATGMDRAEIALRLAATHAVMAVETDDGEAAEHTVVWAGRCVDVARHHNVAIVHYVPRAAALCASVLDHLGSDLQSPAIDTVQGWLRGYARALDDIAAKTAEADRLALVALAAEGVDGAEGLASEASRRASSAYEAIGAFDAASALAR
jgi:hypothetical protein